MRPRLSALSALCCALALIACEEAPRDSGRLIQIVDEESRNPVAGLGTGELRFEIDQGGPEHRQTIVDRYSAGTFDIPVVIESYVAPTRISVTIQPAEGEPGGPRIGAVPAFIPFSVGFARVVVGAPLTCAELIDPRLPSERLDLALVSQQSTLWAIGGTQRGTGTDIPLAISAPQLTWPEALVDPTTIGASIEPFSQNLQETQAMRVGDTGAIAILSRTAAFLWTPGAGETPISRHDGAGIGSTLADLGSEGVAIVGGGNAEPTMMTRVGQITWVDAAGATTTTALATPRRNPAAIFVGGVLLIAGGQEDGQPLFEIAPLRSNASAIPSTPNDARSAPILVRDPRHQTAALLGGRDASGELVGEVILVTGCPACELTALPSPDNDWTQPREGPAVVETGRATWILGGIGADGNASDGADRVTVTSVATSIASLERGLDLPRARASAAHLAQGVVVLAGGHDESDRDVDHLTICWPESLEPLD
ncbi:MAG: hypothetical protein M3Y87_21380 [Myxococcota bacterium]|nr:hypothetical protein [Myxococcota bacterium]